jgi:hypothetical protein
MPTPEMLAEFYRQKFNWLPENLGQNVGHFNVFRLEACIGKGATPVQYNRRDFYKISLMRGTIFSTTPTKASAQRVLR